MLAFRDFAPRNQAPPSWRQGAGAWESLEAALAAANTWIESEHVEVVNVETVVLPCHVDTPAFQGTTEPAAVVNGQHWWICKQFVRVWYRVGSDA
jgi:hypothetical protein